LIRFGSDSFASLLLCHALSSRFLSQVDAGTHASHRSKDFSVGQGTMMMPRSFWFDQEKLNQLNIKTVHQITSRFSHRSRQWITVEILKQMRKCEPKLQSKSRGRFVRNEYHVTWVVLFRFEVRFCDCAFIKIQS